MITAEIDQKALDRYLKVLDRNRGKPLLTRAEKLTQGAAARVLVPALRAAAPRNKARGKYVVGRRVKSGNLAKRSRAKLLRKRGGEDIRPTWVGSGAYYTHMVVGGTRPHPLAPRSGHSDYAVFAQDEVRALAGMMHPGSRANPFVARAVDPNLDAVYSIIRKDVYDTRP